MLLCHSLCPQPSTDQGCKAWQFLLCWSQPSQGQFHAQTLRAGPSQLPASIPPHPSPRCGLGAAETVALDPPLPLVGRTLGKTLQLLPQPPLHSPLGCTPGATGTGTVLSLGKRRAQSTCCNATRAFQKPDKKPQQQIKQRSRGGTLILRQGHLLQSQPLKKHQEPPHF